MKKLLGLICFCLYLTACGEVHVHKDNELYVESITYNTEELSTYHLKVKGAIGTIDGDYVIHLTREKGYLNVGDIVIITKKLK